MENQIDHNQSFQRLSRARSLSTPAPHVPLRKESAKRLRLRALQPHSLGRRDPESEKPMPATPLYDEPDWPLRQLTPNKHSNIIRDGKFPLSGSEAALESTTAATQPSPLASAVSGERSLSLSSPSPSSSLSTPPHNAIGTLWVSRSIPDMPHLPMSYRNSSSAYRPDRGPNNRDSYHSSLRRDPPPHWREGRHEEVRGSFRSALTNGSSYVDTSGTERSSVITGNSSTTDLANASSESVNMFQGTPNTGDEGMSVDDAIDMYAGDFRDDSAAEDDMETSKDLLKPRRAFGKQLGHEHRRSKSASIIERLNPRFLNASGSSGPSAPSHARSPARTLLSDGRSIPQEPPGLIAMIPLKVPRDRYGFKKASQYLTPEQYDTWNKPYTEYLGRRRRKWVTLMKHYGLPTDHPVRFPPRSEKIKRYIRKGIPPEWRGAAWFWYADGPAHLAKNPGLYWDLIEQVDQGEISEADREHIERDLNRTFPDNIRFKLDPTTTLDSQNEAGGGYLFDGPETPIVRALRRVLQAFATHNPSIGYCQSLNFLAGLLLLFLGEDEEKAFVMLNIITTIHLPGTHGVVLEGANVDIGVLMTSIKESLPAVWAQIDDKEPSASHASVSTRLPTVSLATTAWFMSLYVGTLPIESVLRVWDSFFYEGSKTLFRIALAIFKLGEPEIKAVSDHMEIFQVVQTIPRKLVDANALMETCFKRWNGFGHLSQEVIDSRRAERRRGERARAAGMPAPAADGTVTKQPSSSRRAASRARLRRSKPK
ncbi:hypothetical protein LTR04_007262 [Oleoguttula sp. CCFEE 6159]|nr:hypothetical protein LTR04_007262 [Oleoguttula sp. CCFEE 6159]